jgi:hypothetical protein
MNSYRPTIIYRHLDQSLALAFVRDLVNGAYAADGGTSIDPVLFFRLQIVMFFEGSRSERKLMRAVADRLSARWYLGVLGQRAPAQPSPPRAPARHSFS